jgi:hypothetical protein
MDNRLKKVGYSYIWHKMPKNIELGLIITIFTNGKVRVLRINYVRIKVQSIFSDFNFEIREVKT